MSEIGDLAGKVSTDQWLNSMYSQSIANQKTELSKLFTQVADTKLANGDKAKLASSQEILKKKVEVLEAEMAELEEKMAANEEEIKKKADEITDLIANVKNEAESLEQEQKQQANKIVSDVLKMDNLGPDGKVAEMQARLKAYSNSHSGKLDGLIANLEDKKSEVKGIIENAQQFIDRKKILESKFGVTKSTYDLITKNLNAVTITDANITNNDLNTARPIYSATKLENLTTYFEDSKINVQAGDNSKYKEGTKAPVATLDSINEKYKDYLKTEKTQGISDSYKIENQAIVNLGKAIEGGLLNDLKLAGITGSKLVDFLSENFAGANIKKADDGTLKIPYGHDAEARNIFASLTHFVKAQSIGDDPSQWESDYFKCAENTWDKSKGNTIDTNAQIKALSENFNNIAQNLVDKGFTFKEAMFALFNQDNGLFKDSGIIYDLNKQTGENPNYFMEFAGDDATAAAYKDIATFIYKNWGVKPTMCMDYDNIDNEPSYSGEDTPVAQVDRTDPLSFIDGNSEYTFIVDRDSDGRFDGAKEFLGGDSSKTWLDDLKALDANNDGVLDGDELEKLQLLKSDIKDNSATEQSGNFTRSETTTISYEFTNAKDLGIESINLKDLEQNVNQKAGRTDVNNSEVFNDSFTFKMNGKEVTAKRKDDTEEYMNAVYGNTYGARLDNKSGLTEDEINKTIEDDYNEFDKFNDKFKDYEQNFNTLKAFDSSLAETKAFADAAQERSQNESLSIIKRGQFKAKSQSTSISNWSQMQKEVQKAADQMGVTYNFDLETQAKGMFAADSSLSAQDLVNNYLENKNAVEKADTKRANANVALDAIVACAKQGIAATYAEITKLLEDGTVKTKDEIVEYFQKQQEAQQAE